MTIFDDNMGFKIQTGVLWKTMSRHTDHHVEFSTHTSFFSFHMYLLTIIPSDENTGSVFSYLK